jgi:hypothetical protein
MRQRCELWEGNSGGRLRVRDAAKALLYRSKSEIDLAATFYWTQYRIYTTLVGRV